MSAILACQPLCIIIYMADPHSMEPAVATPHTEHCICIGAFLIASQPFLHCVKTTNTITPCTQEALRWQPQLHSHMPSLSPPPSACQAGSAVLLPPT